jgi:endonuclease/exonuclease/phosphatase family metal-dependent hydrolase
MIGTEARGVNSGAALPACRGVTAGAFPRILPGTVSRIRAAVFTSSLLLASCAALPAPRDRLASPGGRPVPAGATITVVTYNVLHGFGDRLNDRTLEARLGLLARALDAADPDLIMLQEVSLTPSRKHGSVAERLRDLLNVAALPAEVYGSAVAMAHGSRLIAFFEGSAILSRYDIESAETIGYRVQSRFPPERRIALRVVLRGERGQVEVVGTHLTHVEARRGGVLVRELQARELADRVIRSGDSTRPLVIGGDFNSLPGSAVVAGMLEAGVADAWAAARPGEDGFTALEGAVTDPAARATERIDYVFVRGARVLEAVPFLDEPGTGPHGLPLWASDHVGVLARIEFP